VVVMHDVQFYTYPPAGVEYDYVLRNIKQNERPCKHQIVDIGIYDLIKPPYMHTDDKIRRWEQLDPGNGWKVVPDAPDITGEFGVEVDYDNVKYTFELLRELYDPDDPTHLPVLQSRYQDINSLRDSILKFKKLYGVVDKLGIGSVCRANNIKFVVRAIRMIRRAFPNTHLHVFGLRFHHLRRVYYYVDSYDTTAWTFPRTGGRPSCKNKKECTEYFYEYLRCLESLKQEMNKEKTLWEYVDLDVTK